MLASHELLIETAFTEHQAALVRRLTGLTRDPEGAQDIAQEAFLRLSREIAEGRTPDDAGAWLHRVGWNLAMSRGRHQSVANRRSAELVPPADHESPEHAVVRHETNALLRSVVAGLPVTERTAVVLAAQGYPGQEIATSLGRTPGATRTLLCRARSKVRDQMLISGYVHA
jgi:RNA polymerase sigma-70 factor (ECF subfamily)